MCPNEEEIESHIFCPSKSVFQKICAVGYLWICSKTVFFFPLKEENETVSFKLGHLEQQ